MGAPFFESQRPAGASPLRQCPSTPGTGPPPTVWGPQRRRWLALVTVCCESSSTTFHSTCRAFGGQDGVIEGLQGPSGPAPRARGRLGWPGSFWRTSSKLASMRRPRSGSIIAAVVGRRGTRGARGQAVVYGCAGLVPGTLYCPAYYSGQMRKRAHNSTDQRLEPSCQPSPATNARRWHAVHAGAAWRTAQTMLVASKVPPKV